jgi:hypothetical protein
MVERYLIQASMGGRKERSLKHEGDDETFQLDCASNSLQWH